jgi:hypothetical protein
LYYNSFQSSVKTKLDQRNAPIAQERPFNAGGRCASQCETIVVAICKCTAIAAVTVDAALALFHEDAIYNYKEEVFHGKDEIRKRLETIVERKYKYDVNNFNFDGNTLIWFTKEIGGDLWSSYELVIEGGKIMSLSKKR